MFLAVLGTIILLNSNSVAQFQSSGLSVSSKPKESGCTSEFYLSLDELVTSMTGPDLAPGTVRLNHQLRQHTKVMEEGKNPVLRIRIGSRLNGVTGSGFTPKIRIHEGKNDPQATIKEKS